MQKEDIYETEDVPIPEPLDAEEKFESKDIEKVHVDLDEALRHFGNRILNADDVDFSDSLTKKKRRGYRSGNYVLEIVGTENTEPETLPQKFRRLRFEIDELCHLVDKETEKKKDDNAPIAVCKSELEKLNSLLCAAILKSEAGSAALIDTTTSMPATGDQGEAAKKGKSMVSPKPAQSFIERSLDERVKRIENAVGTALSSQRTHHEPLSDTVESLRIQVEALNPAYLDSVAGQLKTAISKLSEYDDKRKKISTEDFEEKINELYKLIVQWDATCANLPSIVKRLHSLSKLHEQAQEFATRLNDLTALKEHLEKKIENQKLMLYELKRDSMKSVVELTNKVAQLEERLAKLHS